MLPDLPGTLPSRCGRNASVLKNVHCDDSAPEQAGRAQQCQLQSAMLIIARLNFLCLE